MYIYDRITYLLKGKVLPKNKIRLNVTQICLNLMDFFDKSAFVEKFKKV
jgi:hypothetical protein